MSANIYDVLIWDAKVIDGAGGPWYRAGIGVSDGKISRLGFIGEAEAKERMDARDLVVTPGFFDVHMHSDFSLIRNSFPKSQLLQGVTSEVDGNCGYSAFPLMEFSRGVPFEPPGMDID